MNYAEYLFMKAGEECNEIGQAAAKTSLFGLDSIVPDKGITNEEHLIYEIHDLLAVVELLKENGLLNFQINPDMITAKKRKMINIAKDRGILSGEQIVVLEPSAFAFNPLRSHQHIGFIAQDTGPAN